MKLLDRLVLNRLVHTILDFITKLCEMFLDKSEKEPTETNIDNKKPVRRKLLKRIFNE